MGKNCIQQIRSILNSTSGLTIVELLIAATVGITVLGIALSVALSSHRVYQYDQARTALNQNLRIAIDLLSIDVLQAGERVPGTFPAIELIDGDNGAPDQLMLRQNLLDQVLPVCKRVRAGTATNVVFAALAANPPQGCERSSQQNNFDAWRNYRQNQ
ncbi:MAG: hypothetical protein D6736_01335 [Nitrospinota bacterium]|nr:MAG: hypothetical protein D6736_01335 [Nitrospinota bacterium]